MLQSTKLPSRFLHQLLLLSARPSTRLDGLLQFVLEKALALTASDVGGGMYLFETWGQEPVLVASALRGELADDSANLLQRWKEKPSSLLLTILQSGQPYRSEDHHQDPVYFPMLAGSRSSLWVPLLDGRRIAGVIHVESSQPAHYTQQHIGQLQGLAVEAVPAIHRLLLREQMAQAGAHMDMVGASPAFLELERQIKLVAAYARGPVLITGERGSGKELSARAIHAWSDRRHRPFVPVLASTFAETLSADELFGHERHAFTGAARERPGKFQAAAGGTIFFDEIGDMTLTVQSALLRVIERGELSRIGRDLPLRVDVCVVAATNRTLPELIAQGRFREDLYDRLRVFEIRVPPLRERREDIPLLASHFFRKYCQQTRRYLGFEGEGICAACQQVGQVGCATAEFYQALQSYDWPGNVRELENLILRLVATIPAEILEVKHLPELVQQQSSKAREPEWEGLTLDAAMRDHIERVLRMTNYNQSHAARILGLPFSTLQSKIKKLGIEIKKA